MRLNIFVKTFMILLVSFSVVFFFSIRISYNQFSPMYIEENIDAVKESIEANVTLLSNGASLVDTTLLDLSSETSFTRYKFDGTLEQIGPSYLEEANIVTFVASLYAHEDAVTEGKLTYYTELKTDVYHVNYIYEFELGDYLIISTRIQSLTNVDRVLNTLNMYQMISVFVVIVLLSFIISMNISSPLRKINKHAQRISNLDFTSTLDIKRNDEFRDLVSRLNEMTFNLQKAYTELQVANDKLANQIDYEQEQERQKEQFIMTINHELKTPLAVMKAMIEGMIDQVGRYQNRDQYLPELTSQIDIIEQITKDLTYTLKLQDKVNDGDSVSTDTISTLLQPLQDIADSKSRKIHVKIDDATLKMNRELFEIMVQNIVKNALYYTTDSKVYVSGIKQNDSYVLEVRNKGHINEEDMKHIFTSFYRSDETKQYQKGTGLGLSIVKQICDMYRYQIKIYNDHRDVVVKCIIETM